jgi:putative transposase
MNILPKELMKEYVTSQNFTSTADIMAAMKELFKDALQQVMECELDAELGYEKSERLSNECEENLSKNYRNGYSKKTVKTQLGEVEVNVPRDRNGEYEPKVIGKYSRNADGMEEKIIALFSCGMSQHDISEQLKNLYDVEISPELVSKISEKIMPEIAQWQSRALEAVYPFIFMDAIYYKVKENNQYVNKAAYVVLGVTMEGNKDILGIWIGESESSKFWASVLNDLKSRGVNDVFLFCVDGLKGFPEAISAIFPKSQIQRCIIHQIRYSTRFVGYKDIKELMSDLKLVYKAVTEEEAVNNLIKFKDKWGKKYPSCIKSWEDNWDILSTFFAYPADIRRIIYTTNIIEGLNRQFRQLTKNKPTFQNDDSLKKMLYLASKKIVERWTQRCRNWDIALNQLNIMFEGRVA